MRAMQNQSAVQRHPMAYSYDKPDSSVGTLALDLDGAGAANDNLYTLAYNQIPQIASVTATRAAFDWNGYSDVNRGYSANGLNQYTQSGTKTLGYDDNGNLISDQTWAFGYSAENELTSASATGAALTYRYDGLGRMDRRQLNGATATDYLYDGQSLIAEHDAGANPQGKRYVHGAGIDNPIVEYTRQGDGTYARLWYAMDFRGSIVATTNDAGTTTAIYSYGDYGEPNTPGGPAFRYTGQRLDAASGLYYYKARWYSPNLGRFLQTDPIGTSDQLNLYAYVANDPVNLIDPTGMTSAEWSGGEIVVTARPIQGPPNLEAFESQSGDNASSIDKIVLDAQKNGSLAGAKIEYNLKCCYEQGWAGYSATDIVYLGVAGQPEKSAKPLKGGTAYPVRFVFPRPDPLFFIHSHPNWAYPTPGSGDFGHSIPVYIIHRSGVRVVNGDTVTKLK